MRVHLKNFAGFVFLFVSLLSPVLQAQSAAANLGEVASDWPGVNLQIAAIQRIPNNRLLVLVRIEATAKASPSTLIGYPPVIPPNASKEAIASGRFEATPFSLESSVMIDEQTGIKYPVLSPQPADAGHAYRPSSLIASVTIGQAAFMSVQFAVPPPPSPPLDEFGKPIKQTVSLLLPKAKGPIARVPVPPLVPGKN